MVGGFVFIYVFSLAGMPLLPLSFPLCATGWQSNDYNQVGLLNYLVIGHRHAKKKEL
jgi:hypothetical protein